MSNKLLTSLSTLSTPLSTSFGPTGTDTLIVSGKTSTITNDGSTIINLLTKRSIANSSKSASENDFFSNSTMHPALSILTNLASTQDLLTGDGTTSIVLLAGALSKACNKILEQQYHPNKINDCLQFIKKEIEKNFLKFSEKIFETEEEFLEFKQTKQLDKLLSNKHYERFYNAVKTCLSSKIMIAVIEQIAPIAIQAVLKTEGNIENINIKKICGGMDEIKLIDGIVISDNNIYSNSEDEYIDYNLLDNISEKTLRTAVVKFNISPPTLSLDSELIINDASQLNSMINQEKQYIRNICAKLSDSKVQLLLIQKSLTKNTISSLGKHYLKKLKIQYKILSREEIEKLESQLDLKASTSVDFIRINSLNFNIDKISNEKILSLSNINNYTNNNNTNINNNNKCMSIAITATETHILDEFSRSLDDVLGVVRCLYTNPYYTFGGGNFELRFADHLRDLYFQSLNNINNNDITCYPFLPELADAFEELPLFLAKNSGLDHRLIAELRNALKLNNKLGVIPNTNNEFNNYLKKSTKIVGQMRAKCFVAEIGELYNVTNIVAPIDVYKNMVRMCCEAVGMVVKIDEVLPARQ